MTQQASTPRLRPVIRVFVSSTFSDMKHERNALEADAFLKLEQLCQRQGFQFQAIDLRFRLRPTRAVRRDFRETGVRLDGSRDGSPDDATGTRRRKISLRALLSLADAGTKHDR